jgi:hypothetical protein
VLKAIETVYAGHRFRSRLEARVAVFLDSLGWSWTYEPEGYELPYSGRYLPDFIVHKAAYRLPEPFWLEVKPRALTRDEINKLRELACLSGHHAYVIGSNLKNIVEWAEWGPYFGGEINPDCIFIDHQCPHSTFSPLRDRAGEVEPAKEARDDFFTELNRLITESWGYPCSMRPFITAARKALSARFEHGESPAR